MLKDRIVLTLQFFDLQDYPLTLMELGNFLLPEPKVLKTELDEAGEITEMVESQEVVGLDAIMTCLDKDLANEVVCTSGFYSLKGREHIVHQRLKNYVYGVERERIIKRHISGLQNIPFVRGVALAGSQAMGLQKEQSDIDLFIITDPKFLWLARTLVTAYFHVRGVRRHALFVANRFCLNHYLSWPKLIMKYRNLYTAVEYAKLRPLVYGSAIQEFQQNNQLWLKSLLPQAKLIAVSMLRRSSVQRVLEHVLNNGFGRWLDAKLRQHQLPKIRQESSDFAERDELSFHPDSKQGWLVKDFMKKLDIVVSSRNRSASDDIRDPLLDIE